MLLKIWHLDKVTRIARRRPRVPDSIKQPGTLIRKNEESPS